MASDKPNAPALERAEYAGVPTGTFPMSGERADRDRAIADFLAGNETELVVLAGYMALLTPGFLQRFPGRVINVHPALLPAFPGLRAIEQALDYGVKVFGVTVHFVDEGVDTGPIIAQRAVFELPNATEPAAVRARAAPPRARSALRRRRPDRTRRRAPRPCPPETSDG